MARLLEEPALFCRLSESPTALFVPKPESIMSEVQQLLLKYNTINAFMGNIFSSSVSKSVSAFLKPQGQKRPLPCAKIWKTPNYLNFSCNKQRGTLLCDIFYQAHTH